MDAKPYVQSSFTVTSRTQGNIKLLFRLFLGKLNQLFVVFVGSPSVRCQLLGNGKPMWVAARDQ